MESILAVKDLSVDFAATGGAVRAVRELSLELMRGETLALVGKSGSGKTACARAIMGLLPPGGSVSGGKIFYCGRELPLDDDKAMCAIRGREIGMVFQDPFSALNPLMKVGVQIAEAAKRTCGKKLARARALALLEEVGIERAGRVYDEYPFRLSGGMRQRVVIAIALAMNPRVLICDEPTTALDVSVQACVLELLARVRRERALSMLYITHDLGVVAGIADRVAVIENGELAEIGECARVFAQPSGDAAKELLRAANALAGNMEG